MSPRETAVRLLSVGLFLVSAILILTSFDFGFRVTADQREYTYWALTSSPYEWVKKGVDLAHVQGRIGNTFVLPLQIFGGWIGDMWFYPFLCTGILITIFFSFYAWIQLISGSKVALGLSGVYLALLPAGLHHWLPNAYPMLFLPLAFGLLCRLAFQRLYGSPGFTFWWKGVLGLGIWAAAISYEISLVLLASMAAFEIYSYVFIDKLNQKRIAAGHLVWQIGIVGIALASYLAYRFLHPSLYPGNQLPTDTLSDQIKVVLLHLYYATSFDHIQMADWGEVTNKGILAVEAVVVLVGLSTIIATSRPDAPPHWRSLVIFGCIIALLTTLPIAANHKYVEWCVSPSRECTYIDARFSLMGIGLTVFYAAWGLLPRIVFQSGFAAAIGTIGALTFLVNATADTALRLRSAADSAAKAYVCELGKKDVTDAELIEHLMTIEKALPFRLFHSKYDDTYKVQYWDIYLKHLQDLSPFWLCG